MTKKPKIEFIAPEEQKPKKGAGGRPTKYSKKMITQVDKYLLARQDETEEKIKYQSENSTGYYEKTNVKLPTIEGFALFVGVNKTTLYEWADKHPEFSNALGKIRTEQRERLIDNGLSGDYNPTIAKLILSSNHGMNEKKEVDHTSGGEKITGFNYVTPEGVGEDESND